MAQDEPGGDPVGGTGQAGRSLEERLKAAHHAEAVRTGKASRSSQKGNSQGSRVLAELVAAPAGGAIVGWLLDRWLGTSPWLLLVMLFLGFGVAMRNIYRISNERPE